MMTKLLSLLGSLFIQALKDRLCHDRHQRRPGLAGSPISPNCSADMLTLCSDRFLRNEQLRANICTRYPFLLGKLGIQGALGWKPEGTSGLADVCCWYHGPLPGMANITTGIADIFPGGDATKGVYHVLPCVSTLGQQMPLKVLSSPTITSAAAMESPDLPPPKKKHFGEDRIMWQI